MTSIGNNAFLFYENSNITAFTIPDTVTRIGDLALCGCNALTALTIPTSMTSIDTTTFSGCWNMTSVMIPVSVTSIGNRAFSYNNSLADVLYAGTIDQWNAISIGSGNEPLTNANIHFNSTGN